MKEKSMLDY